LSQKARKNAFLARFFEAIVYQEKATGKEGGRFFFIYSILFILSNYSFKKKKNCYNKIQKLKLL